MKLAYGIIMSPEETTLLRAHEVNISQDGFFGYTHIKDAENILYLNSIPNEDFLDKKYFDLVDALEDNEEIYDIANARCPELMVIK